MIHTYRPPFQLLQNIIHFSSFHFGRWPLSKIDEILILFSAHNFTSPKEYIYIGMESMELTDFELRNYSLSFLSDLKFIQNFTFLQDHILEFRMISWRSDSTKLCLKWVPVHHY